MRISCDPLTQSPQFYEWLIRQVPYMHTTVYIREYLPARRLHVVSLTCNFFDETKGLNFAAPIISMAHNDLLNEGMSDT